MGKHTDPLSKSSVLNSAAEEINRLKRFGVTGVLRLLISAAGSFFTVVVILSCIEKFAYDDSGIILITGNAAAFVVYMVFMFEFGALYFTVLSFAEQGIRKLFKSKKAENFAAYSIETLLDIDDENDY